MPRMMNRDGSWAEPEPMSEWQEAYDFWTDGYWECPSCGEQAFDGPFEDSGVCVDCA